MLEDILFVNYHTPDYKRHADRLRASLERFGLTHAIWEVERNGTWRDRCLYKAHFLYDICVNHPDWPIVWLDADAELLQRPELFVELDKEGVDVAAHASFQWNERSQKEFISACLFFGETDARRGYLYRVRDRCKKYPGKYHGDQEHFRDEVASGKRLHFVDLPRSYCQINKAPTLDMEPVIYQHQASRTMRKRVDRMARR